MLDANLARFVLPRDLKLINVKRHKGGYLWEVEKVRQKFEICTKCATPSTIRAGRCTSTVKDEPLRSEKLWLKIHKHRYFCRTCRKTFTETASVVWPRRRTTQRLRRRIGKDCASFSDLKEVRERYQISSGLIYDIFYEQLAMKLKERQGARWPDVIGIDEHFFKRGGGFTEFVTVFTDLKKRELFEVALSKRGKDLMQQLREIPGRENVKVVVMDLSSGYRAFATKMFPNALVVADKFHVLRLLSPAIMREGRSIHGHRQELNLRRKLLRSRKNLEYFQRQEVDHYLAMHPALNELYRAKERLYELYRTKGVRRAIVALNNMLADFKNSQHEAIRKLGRTLKAWRKEILFYFERRYTNGFTEAMNNLGKLVQKRGFGYKSFKNYRLRVLTVRLF
jgi:transposase